ncbi:integrase catalytic domain-containing protein [Trichonephila clavipes]|nr:integrase catalytic domain-containing protein [Trichonephila clavipes]
MSLNKLGKDELKIVAEELNLTVPEGAKIAGLKNLIVNSDVYKNDKELVQSAIDYALAEIKNKRLDSEIKLEFERIKLAQLQKQLELANIQKNLPQNPDIRNPSVFETAANCNVETLLKSVKTLTIPVPSRVESYNLFFQSLEKAFKIKEVPEQFKGEILLNILGERVNNLLVHVSEEELNNYSKLKDLVLKEFSPTPQECYNRFQKAQKLSSESYVQFASRLCATFEYYCQLRNVNDFKSLYSINETKVHCGLIRDEDLNKNLEKFWKLEEIEEPIVKNKERLICEEHYANTHFRTKEGKYVVSMPLKKEPSCLGNSKDIALKRLGSLWNRLARDDNYLNLYREFLRDYERLGHMKEVTNETEPKIAYYATHHGIYRPEKSTTKLRVVFNCSSLTDNGISLNDIQYNGGVIQEDLYAQMLRFRTYTYAFTADIKMMYRTILINPKQRSLQRIVWCESEHESPKIYELSTVTYGTVSAPYLAQRTLTQLSMDEEANFPIAASVLRNNLYMDDVLCGAATLEEAIVLRQQLKGILKSAGMELHKLCANHEKLSPGPEQNYNFATLTETKTLGVSWKPNLDFFLIKVKVCLDSSYTKRDVLSTIAKIFDPVGLMAPVISKAKIFLQRLWRSKLEWNDLLPAEEYREWQQFLVSLENINNIEIPRRILVAFPEVTEIHGFADASERCYGAAVYCKSKNLKSETLVRLITSKSRVAPIKSLTIPRLELCAAVLLAKLVKRVVAALQLETAEIYLWSDSMIVMAWLRKEPMDLKTFVQNRVGKIQELYPNQLWRHVPSDQNPADLVSRGVDPEKLLQQNLWFNGPTFLSGDDYPNRTINCREKLDEYNSELKNCVNEQIENFQSVLNIHVNDFLNDLLNLNNNYITILRVLSFIFRFVENLKGINKVAGPLTTKEFEKAETYLVKKVQEQEFSSDINHLKSKGSVLPNTVHIELVSDLTSQAFIAALKRFMARRGKCAKLFSDNGKNFFGASNEIKKLLEIVRKPDEKLANYLAAEGIEWKFIPARSPNFGGLWEAAIKSYKYHLKRVVNGINLTYEELLTVTVQIEGILNSRPLCPLSNNDDDFQVLTPAHFLINRSLNSLEEPNLTKCKESNLKQWQKITKIVQLMWKFGAVIT